MSSSYDVSLLCTITALLLVVSYWNLHYQGEMKKLPSKISRHWRDNFISSFQKRMRTPLTYVYWFIIPTCNFQGTIGKENISSSQKGKFWRYKLQKKVWVTQKYFIPELRGHEGRFVAGKGTRRVAWEIIFYSRCLWYEYLWRTTLSTLRWYL